MHQNPVNAYTTIQKESLSGRELEASVLARAGLMLKHVQENWDAPDREAKFIEAIKFNQKVWSFFQAELSDPENPLPKKLREDILNLSIFVDKRLFEVMSQPLPEKLTIVIDINFNIAAGLRAKAVQLPGFKIAYTPPEGRVSSFPALMNLFAFPPAAPDLI